MKGIVLISAIALALMVCVADAFADGRTSYFSFKAGMLDPAGDMDDADTGYNLEASLGDYFHEHLIIEGSLGLYSLSEQESGTHDIYGAWSGKEELDVMPLTVTFKGVASAGAWEFYFGAGAGLYFVSYSIDLNTMFGSDTRDDTDIVLGYHAVLGTSVGISDESFFGIDIIMHDTETATASDTLFGFPVQEETDLNGYALRLVYGFAL